MKSVMCIVAIIIVLLLPLAHSRNLGQSRIHHGHHRSPQSTSRSEKGVKPMNYYWERTRHGGDTLQVAGSRLPDCSHACGSCTPCRLVMVSFVCSSIEEAETCPMAYKCMCRNKSYPVP
ncbi:protein EPIDERMAL PATTERNING FACTOR 1-like [Rutidosis leptorrhynchoides]|uniref:protein EPIDERMAL PATTERNING FACTOR 1-like n=1 Tax=Rutidosis leptorrhynchoides TaxID=125765 RepID=UPI003A992D0B